MREGKENNKLCPDGESRTFRSKLEEKFVDYCEMMEWEIINYGDKSFSLADKELPEAYTEKDLEEYMYDTGIFGEVKKMRKPSPCKYTPDFIVKIRGEEWVVEVKAFWKNSHEDCKGKMDVEEHIAYQLRKSIFFRTYEVNFMEVSTDVKGNNFTCLYYRSGKKKK